MMHQMNENNVNMKENRCNIGLECWVCKNKKEIINKDLTDNRI